MFGLLQVLIYFAVAKKGEAPIDGVTDANPEGLTSACGKWAGEFKERVAKGGLTCHVLPEDKYGRRSRLFFVAAVLFSGGRVLVHCCALTGKRLQPMD